MGCPALLQGKILPAVRVGHQQDKIQADRGVLLEQQGPLKSGRMAELEQHCALIVRRNYSLTLWTVNKVVNLIPLIRHW